MSNVVYLHGEPPPVAQFLRIGNTGHRRLEQFLAAGQLPYQRFVVDAGMFTKQKDLISALRQAEKEIILDTNVAELSAIGRYDGVGRDAPWADQSGVLTEAHFRVGNNEFDLTRKIAHFVVEQDMKWVMAPSRFVAEATNSWFRADIRACEALRLVSCDDPLCCRNGFDDTRQDPKGHYLRQRACQCEALSKVPDQANSGLSR